MITLIEMLLSLAPSVLQLSIICITLLSIILLLLLAFVPTTGTTLAHLIHAWRSSSPEISTPPTKKRALHRRSFKQASKRRKGEAN